MKKLMAALLLAGACQTAFAAGIDIDNAWARTTVPGMSMGGVFMEIENEGKADDVLPNAWKSTTTTTTTA